MRFRVGLVVCLLLTTSLGLGCRKALTPNVDRNQAPETWITAAPQDTLTVKDPNGKVVPGGPTEIPFKFHLYWAGSDPDGDVVGFYYAVVETLPYNPLGSGPPPSLPGPKAQDYRFTSQTDSTFIFRISEYSEDRQHAFYIYAVDNAGKPDPTPARFIFSAADHYPPLPILTKARGTGLVWELVPGGGAVRQVEHVYEITDTSKIGPPSDKLPTTARLDFEWYSEPTTTGNPALLYRYKLGPDQLDYVEADSSTHSATYNTGPADRVTPGIKEFFLRAIDQAGAKREIKRRFQFNLAPRAWFSGPDVNSPLFNKVETQTGYRYYDASLNFVRGGPRLPEFTGSLLSRDSVYLLPALRPERRTFYEIYKNNIYVHREGDTVNMNSWVVLHNGGLDADSPYAVKVNTSDPDYINTIANVYGEVPLALQPAPANGSPVGFRANMATTVWPTGQLNPYTQTGMYPIFNPNDVKRLTQLAQYWPVLFSGRAYLFARAEDGDGRAAGGLDESLSEQLVDDIVDRVDPSGNADPNGTGGTPQDRALRQQILVFYVGHPPVLSIGDIAFKPKPNTVYTSRLLDVNLRSTDLDPYNYAAPVKPFGGPTAAITRYRIWVRGIDATTGLERTFDDYARPPYQTTPTFNIILPTWLTGTSAGGTNVNVTLRVEVCDCLECELQGGSGRCSTSDIPIVVPAPPSGGASSMALPSGEPGPGSAEAVRSTSP